jgi:hypothetical protein
MKKISILMLILPIWAGCTKSDALRIKDFTHTGCATSTDTRAVEDDETVSLLTLKFEDGDLRVIRTNVLLNCPVEEDGLVCHVSVDGDVIHYIVEKKAPKNGMDTDCICRVEEVSSLITGLETGKEYTFDYAGSPRIKPFTFVFEKGLFLVKD